MENVSSIKHITISIPSQEIYSDLLFMKNIRNKTKKGIWDFVSNSLLKLGFEQESLRIKIGEIYVSYIDQSIRIENEETSNYISIDITTDIETLDNVKKALLDI